MTQYLRFNTTAESWNMLASTSNSDLILGSLWLLVLSGMMYHIGQRIVHSCQPRTCTIVALVAFSLTMIFAVRYHGQLKLASLIPLPNAIVLANLLPVGASILSGLIIGQTAIPAWRRWMIVAALGGIGWYTVGIDLFAAQPKPDSPRYRDGICMQTTPDSCSACCAAILLTEHGIGASESEMMGLCFTRRGGTPELGLYRGLKLKTAGTPWDVEVLDFDVDTFLEDCGYPALLLVRSDLDDDRSLFHRSFRANHAVVAFGKTNQNKILIADPSAGLHSWSIARLRKHWCGGGLRLIARK